MLGVGGWGYDMCKEMIIFWLYFVLNRYYCLGLDELVFFEDVIWYLFLGF